MGSSRKWGISLNDLTARLPFSVPSHGGSDVSSKSWATGIRPVFKCFISCMSPSRGAPTVLLLDVIWYRSVGGLTENSDHNLHPRSHWANLEWEKRHGDIQLIPGLLETQFWNPLHWANCEMKAEKFGVTLQRFYEEPQCKCLVNTKVWNYYL